jgi:hypothetical protein
MLLNEFFGSAIALGKKEDHKNPDNKNNTDQVFWFILDHNKLHKEHFHPLARKIKNHHKEDKLDKELMTKEFMPMVKKGCLEFYHTNKMTGKMGKLFPKEMLEDLCERLYDHYSDDIIKDRHYKIGD